MAYPSFYIVDGWSVYKFEDNRSEANLMVFARGGYKKQEVRLMSQKLLHILYCLGIRLIKISHHILCF